MCDTGHYIQHPVTNQNGKEYEKEYIYVQMSHFAVWKKLTQHCKSLHFNKTTTKNKAIIYR